MRDQWLPTCTSTWNLTMKELWFCIEVKYAHGAKNTHGSIIFCVNIAYRYYNRPVLKLLCIVGDLWGNSARRVYRLRVYIYRERVNDLQETTDQEARCCSELSLFAQATTKLVRLSRTIIRASDRNAKARVQQSTRHIILVFMTLLSRYDLYL